MWASGFSDTDIDTGGCTDDDNPDATPSQIFTDYPWLNDLFNETACTAEKIAVYQQGIYTYLLVTDAAGTAILYNQNGCLLYTSPSPRDATLSRMPSSA